MKGSLAEIVKNIAKRNEAGLNRKISTFVICIIISALFWLTLSLSKTYSGSVSLPVRYVNYPANKVVNNQLPTSLAITIESTGFNYLLYKWSIKKKQLILDISDAYQDKNRSYKLPIGKNNDKLSEQFSKDIKILKVTPETITLNVEPKVSKMVPIKHNINLSLAPHYQLNKAIQLNPKRIKITGSKDQINLIDTVELETTQLLNLNSSKKITIAIKPSEHLENIELSDKTVTARLEVDKFTEAQSEVPLTVKNLPAGFTIKLFPDVITVKYKIGFKDFKNINEELFKAEVDFKEGKNNRLTVKLVDRPNTINTVKLIPEKVEFIIKK